MSRRTKQNLLAREYDSSGCGVFKFAPTKLIYEIVFKSKALKLMLFFFIVLMPCPFTGPKKFCAGPNFLRQSKN
jgi:hypothetical protein